jgi:hypothetical protein
VVSITLVGIWLKWFCIVESFASCMGCNPLILSSLLASSLVFADLWWALPGSGFNVSSLNPQKLASYVGCNPSILSSNDPILLSFLASSLMLAGWWWALHRSAFNWNSSDLEVC